jgi:hypothetical protein
MLWILPLLSIAVQVNPDSNETRLGVAVGGGSYSLIDRDCSGKAVNGAKVPFVAGSASIEQRMPGHIVIGGKVDYFRRGTVEKPVGQDGNTFFYPDFSPQENLRTTGVFLTPYFGLEERGIGVEAGVIIPTQVFHLGLASSGGLSFLRRSYDNLALAGKIRFGPLDRLHVESSYNFSSPLVAGGGLVDVGVGVPFSEGLGRVWLGVDAVPYETSGLLLKTTIPLSEQVFFMGSGRYAKEGGAPGEYAWSLGFNYRWHNKE